MVRGRPKKATLNSVVEIQSPKYGVVVAYRSDVKSNRYLAVETDALGRFPKGAAVWLDSAEFTPIGRSSRKAGRIYRKVIGVGSPEMRGCACVCCPHVAGVEPDPE